MAISKGLTSTWLRISPWTVELISLRLKHHSFTRLTRSLVLIWKDTTDGLESWRTFSTMLEVPMLKHSNGSSLIRLG